MSSSHLFSVLCLHTQYVGVRDSMCDVGCHTVLYPTCRRSVVSIIRSVWAARRGGTMPQFLSPNTRGANCPVRAQCPTKIDREKLLTHWITALLLVNKRDITRYYYLNKTIHPHHRRQETYPYHSSRNIGSACW